ncbi:BTB domain-containing protein [Caenorhabditis elegans]|uniref:BTB domain-containing protein n=1 Tax=Caenorhabditis elegans TaxID=6239 RepID=Q9TYJ0_CAEEL|nr:BTB domain-containing protein [Caenorhabditis elegans]CCD69498.1 BTB domain-containing protein [Caenorhabditis elegans]|eukprot:NP_494524.1 BTB and MATH domain containing [Caenorhabditis elegans]
MVKEIGLTHIFKNVSELEKGKYFHSPAEEHFNVRWNIKIARKNENIGVYLCCQRLKDIGEGAWSVDTEYRLTVKNSIGKRLRNKARTKFVPNSNEWGWEFSWETLIKDYLIDDSIIVEAEVKIRKMTGIPRKLLSSFEQSDDVFSDVVLAVYDKKFFVLKKFLATHSSYFKTLFLGKFDEPEKAEIALTDINAADFQCLLEVLYGEPAIEDENVEGILHLAHMYKMAVVIEKCVEFLSDKSEKLGRDKFRIAKQYQLDNLKKSCLSKINTITEIKSAMAGDLSDMDPTVVAALLEKSVALH